MAHSAKIVALKIVALAAAALLATGLPQALAQQAQAQRCEGTLCDLYYSSRPDAPAAQQAAAPTTPGVPAGATPLTAPAGGTMLGWFNNVLPGGGSGQAGQRPAPPPSEEASSTNSYMHLGTGGLLGDHNQRCSGTLCDAFYGSSPAEPSAAAPVATAGQQAAMTSPPATGREPVVPHRHIVHESETRPACSSTAADPWRCMR